MAYTLSELHDIAEVLSSLTQEEFEYLDEFNIGKPTKKDLERDRKYPSIPIAMSPENREKLRKRRRSRSW